MTIPMPCAVDVLRAGRMGRRGAVATNGPMSAATVLPLTPRSGKIFAAGRKSVKRIGIPVATLQRELCLNLSLQKPPEFRDDPLLLRLGHVCSRG